MQARVEDDDAGEQFDVPSRESSVSGNGILAPGWSDDDEPVVVPGRKTGRIVWTAPSNRLVTEAANRLATDCPDKIVTHIYPFIEEVQNIFNKEPVRPKVPKNDLRMAALGAFLVTCEYHYELKRFLDSSPGANPHSLSESAKRLVLNQPEKHSIMRRAIYDKRNDTHSFFENRDINLEAAIEVLFDAAQQSDAIFGTSISIQQFANKMDWKPDLIVLDKIEQMTECLASIAMDKWFNAAHFFVADPNLVGSISSSADSIWFNSHFGEQRKISLFERARFAGEVDIMLEQNNRRYETLVAQSEAPIEHGDDDIYDA